MKLEIVFKDGRKEIFDSVASFNIIEEKNINEECYSSVVTQTPTEGQFFKVNPLGIDRRKFEKPISNRQKERTRQIIQEAFAEVDKNPEKYACEFYTLIPKKEWHGYRKVVELNAYASNLGGMMADWVEQALEWAQRICNGESWDTICINADMAKWCRVIRWKNGSYRLVGGSRLYGNCIEASYILHYNYSSIDRFDFAVPLVVCRTI